jgi:hypothetical protein
LTSLALSSKANCVPGQLVQMMWIRLAAPKDSSRCIHDA